MDGLPESLDHRHAPHILHCLVVHVRQGVLVLLDVLCHLGAHHLKHGGKSQHNGQKADQPEPPVEQEQQNDHADRRGYRRRHIGKLVSQIRLGGRAAVVDYAAYFAAAHLADEAQGQLCDMVHQRLADVPGDAESRQVGAHQGADVDHNGQQGEAHRQPAVMDNVSGPGKIRGHRKDLLGNSEQKHEGEQGQHRAGGGQQQG